MDKPWVAEKIRIKNRKINKEFLRELSFIILGILIAISAQLTLEILPDDYNPLILSLTIVFLIIVWFLLRNIFYSLGNYTVAFKLQKKQNPQKLANKLILLLPDENLGCKSFEEANKSEWEGQLERKDWEEWSTIKIRKIKHHYLIRSPNYSLNIFSGRIKIETSNYDFFKEFEHILKQLNIEFKRIK